MLEQERLSYDVRYALLNAQRGGGGAGGGPSPDRTQQLQSLLNARRATKRRGGAADRPGTQEAAAKPAMIQAAAPKTPHQSPVAELVGTAATSAPPGASQRASRAIDRTDARNPAATRHRRIQRRHRPVLLEERRNLPDVRQYQRGAKERRQGIVQARLEQFQTEELLRRARAVEEALKELADHFDPQWSDAQRQATLAELRQLLVERQQLLEKLSSGYSNLTTGLVALDEAQRKLIDQAELYGPCSTAICCGFAAVRSSASNG